MAETPTATTASKEDIAKALDLLKRTREQRAKQQAKLKNDPEAKKKASEASKKRRIQDRLLIEKAKKAGVTVTPAELEKELKK